MSDTYQRIQMQSDIEWKFGRAKLIRNMKRSTTTPSPLNLVTKLFSYIRVLYKAKFKCCRADIIDILRTDEQLPESNSMNPLYETSTSWPPNGSINHRGSTYRTARIEDVIDWKVLVKKFISLRGNTSDLAGGGQVNRDKLASPRESHVNMRARTESGQGRRPGTGMGSTLSLHRVVAATVRKIDIVSNIKDASEEWSVKWSEVCEVWQLAKVTDDFVMQIRVTVNCTDLGMGVESALQCQSTNVILSR